MPVLRSCSKALLPLHRAAVLVRVPQHLEVPSLRSKEAGPAVPRAAVLVRPPQHLEVPSRRSKVAGVLPFAAVLVRVPQHLE
eukprot:CAMPEP_0179887488 /NCGR_PEP_ID=MMETSP0982-20121206/31437_1 /TAXON_ID=483367 /ORGANISM="non described non described, Strain CCMP 2436" /LENGTH=81 /DNA_ID=CAMNT_0021783331 /DNA_START=337 /DNA_END=579 /DNA_ORIENTATION=+